MIRLFVRRLFIRRLYGYFRLGAWRIRILFQKGIRGVVLRMLRTRYRCSSHRRSLNQLSDRPFSTEPLPVRHPSTRYYYAAYSTEHPLSPGSAFASGLASAPINALGSKVICTFPRAEAVETLNRILHRRGVDRGSFEHVDSPGVLMDAAFLHERQGRLAEAETLYKRAIELHRQKLGTADLANLSVANLAVTNLAVAEAQRDLAALYRCQSRYGEAEALLQSALTIFQQQLGADHAQTKAIAADLAQLIIT